VSSTGAVWLRASGMTSGSFAGNPGAPEKGDGAGRMANAPPPEAFQLMLMYDWAGVNNGLCRKIGGYAHQMQRRRLCPMRCQLP